VTLLQVRGDGGRTGLVPAPVEVLAQRDDLVLDRLGGTSWTPVGPA